MVNSIKRPEDVLVQNIVEEIHDNEEEFEQFKFSDGTIQEGIIGNTAIITYPDYEYGYSYLLNRRGEKISLDFGDFSYSFKDKINFKTGKANDSKKDCFNGPFFKRLFLHGAPSDKILYYGFWADCYCDQIDEESVRSFHPFDRDYVGGIIDNGVCRFLGKADYESFTETLLTSNYLLTKLTDIEGEYRKAMYPDYYDEMENDYFMNNEDEWDFPERFGVFDIKTNRQIVKSNLFKIEVKNDRIFLYANKYAPAQLYYPKHPKNIIECVQLRFDQLPYCFELWRPALIESPCYFDEEHGIINIGLYGGLDIYDLISENRQLLLALVRKNCFHLDSGVIQHWEEEYEDLIPKSFFDKLYISNDAHNIYKDIKDASDRLEILGSSVYTYSRIYNCNVPLHTCRKHSQNVTFSELITNDFEYISSLIKLKRVFVELSVLKSLEKCVSDKDWQKYNDLLNFVELWEEEKDEIEDEIKRFNDQEYWSNSESEDYERDTYYALGGDDYDAFRERGGSIDDMMDGIGL